MMYSFTLWLTPLWASVSGLVALSVWSLMKMAFGVSTKAVLLHNTGLPSWAAAASWHSGTKTPRLVLLYLPIVAFLLFTVSVHTYSDISFALIWLTLPLLFVLPLPVRVHVFSRAWTASIVAHIIGTFIAVIAQPVVAWSALAVFVPLERLVSACGIAMVSYALATITRSVRRIYRRFSV